MKKILLGAACVAAMLSSCSKNEVHYNLETADNAVGFGVYTGITSKASVQSIVETSTIQANGFYVFGYYTAGSDWDTADATATPNFMYNQLINYASEAIGTEESSTGYIAKGSWYYSPVKYWSENEDHYYSFFAYAPEVTSIAALSGNSAVDVPTVTFSLNDLTDMVDFVADVKIDVQSKKDDTEVNSTSASNVEFSLLHETTRVGLTAITNFTSSTTDKEEDDTHVIVKSITFTDDKKDSSGTAISDASLFATGATYTFASTNDSSDSEATPTRGTWSAHSYSADAIDISSLLNKNNPVYGAGETKYPWHNGVDVVNGQSTPTNLLANDDSSLSYLFLIPAASGTSTSTATLTVTYDILTVDSSLAKGYALSENNVKTVTIPTALFAQGTAYNLQLTFYLNEVVLSATVEGWGDLSDITVTADNEE